MEVNATGHITDEQQRALSNADALLARARDEMRLGNYYQVMIHAQRAAKILGEILGKEGR